MKKRSLIQPIFLLICVHFRSSAVNFWTEEFTAEALRSPRDAEEYGVTTSFLRPLSSSAFICVHLRLKNLTFGLKSSPGRHSSDGLVADKKSFQFFVFFGFDQTQMFTTIDEVMLKQFADELDVFSPTCRQLAECEIVDTVGIIAKLMVKG